MRRAGVGAPTGLPAGTGGAAFSRQTQVFSCSFPPVSVQQCRISWGGGTLPGLGGAPWAARG